MEMCHYLEINENFFKIRYFQKEKDLILSDYLFSRYRFCKKLKQVSRIWVTFSKRGLQWLYGCHKILGFRVYFFVGRGKCESGCIGNWLGAKINPFEVNFNDK